MGTSDEPRGSPRLPGAARAGAEPGAGGGPSPSPAPRVGGRVLSIQSHVVSGYVGNKAVVLPLQVLGFEVDSVNTVQFSNHTGYPSFTGEVLRPEGLTELLDGMNANGLLRGYTHLLTGFIGSGALAAAVEAALERLRALNPRLQYVCDPVMGDEGRLYVASDIPDAFRRLVAQASLATPNSFEAQLLTGREVTSIASAAAAADDLHALGPATVVVTSLSLPDDPAHVYVFASTTLPQSGGGDGEEGVQDRGRGGGGGGDGHGSDLEGGAPRRVRRYTARVQRLEGYFTGTGDLFSALMLAWAHRSPGDLKRALEMALSSLQAVIRDDEGSRAEGARAEREAAYGVSPPPLPPGKRSASSCRARELRLVPNIDRIRDPPATVSAREWRGEPL